MPPNSDRLAFFWGVSVHWVLPSAAMADAVPIGRTVAAGPINRAAISSARIMIRLPEAGRQIMLLFDLGQLIGLNEGLVSLGVRLVSTRSLPEALSQLFFELGYPRLVEFDRGRDLMLPLLTLDDVANRARDRLGDFDQRLLLFLAEHRSIGARADQDVAEQAGVTMLGIKRDPKRELAIRDFADRLDRIRDQGCSPTPSLPAREGRGR